MNSRIKTSHWEFPPFRLDKANGVLLRGEEVTPLRPKNFAALCYLVERHGRLVTKEELLDGVWGHRCVGDSVLKGCINELRKVLGDNAREPAYLLTVARRGYRFVAAVTAIMQTEKNEALSTSCWLPHPSFKSDCWVGREPAQKALLAAWQRSLARRRQVVFITGEAGIGKSVLVEMFLNHVSVNNPGLLRMRCVEHFGQGEALLPIIEGIETRCHAPGGSELIRLLRLHAPVWLAQLPSVLKPDEREAIQREIFGASRDRMVREGCELLETLSKDAPLILVLEDLHWSDHSTLDFISFMAQRSGPAALLVLATYRPADAGSQSHPVISMHRELQLRELGSELRVDPFSPADIDNYLSRRFPNQNTLSSVSKALFDRTGGNPLFVASLVEYLVSQQMWSPFSQDMPFDSAMPDTIRRVIEREVERLSAEEQHLLGVASLLGLRFPAVLLATVVAKNMDEVERICDALVRRNQILVFGAVEQGSRGDVVPYYAFRHAFYVEVLSQQLPAGLAIRLHQRIGRCLEELHGEQSARYAAELALHFEKGWDWVPAIRSLMQAAVNASHRFANHEACDYLVRALRLIGLLPEEQQLETRIGLLKLSFAIKRSMGDMSGARADLEEVLAAAKTLENYREEVLALIELSRILVWLDRGQCLELAEEAVTQSRLLNDTVTESVVKGTWGGLKLLFGPWRTDYANACYEAMAVVRASSDSRLLHTRLTQHVYVEVLASRYQAACETAEEALILSRTLGDGYMFIVGHYYYGLALLHLGDWGKLRQVAEESRRAFECNEASLPLRLHRQIMIAWLHIEAGNFARAKLYCEEVLSESHGEWATFITVHCSAVLGRSLLGLGDFKEAIRCFDTFFEAEKDKSLPLFFNYLFPACQGAAEAWRAMGNLNKARYYAQMLYDLSKGAPERTYLAISHSLLANICASEDTPKDADSHLLAAIAIVENAEVPLAAWRVYEAAEELCHSRGEPSRANEYRLKKQKVVRKLADSLNNTDPLREHLLRMDKISLSHMQSHDSCAGLHPGGAFSVGGATLSP